jgi:hypothetical protein
MEMRKTSGPSKPQNVTNYFSLKTKQYCWFGLVEIPLVTISSNFLKKCTSGVNFINVLWANFTPANPESTKKTGKLSVFFLRFQDLRTQKLLSECWWNWPLINVSLVVCGNYDFPFWTANTEFTHKRAFFPNRIIKFSH